jgi:hypothetical protein
MLDFFHLRYNGSLEYKDNLFIFDNEEIKLESALRPPE